MHRARSGYTLLVSEHHSQRSEQGVPEGKHPERARKAKNDDRNDCASKAEQEDGLATDMVGEAVPVESGEDLSDVMQRHL